MILGEHEGAVSILKLKGQKALCSMSNRAQTGPQPSFGGSSSQWRSSAALAITVALCKTCSWLLITSRKPCSNPAPCSPECNLLEARVLQTMRASFPRATQGTWDITLQQAGSLLCKVPTWLELVVLPSTGSSTQSFFLAVAVLCREVLISLAGC